MKLTVLMENTTNNSEMITEHGLSLYIEANGHRILFDTGQSEAFADNAKTLGVDLQAIDLAILSHGHYDHSGGWKKFLAENDHAKVYVNEHAFGRFFASRTREIGIDTSLEAEERVYLTGDEHKLADGLTLLTCNGRIPKYHPNPYGLLKMSVGGEFDDDDFLHEQYLLIEEDGKQILISGCSHKGILNITEWFKPDVLIGGFHFKKLDPDGEGREILDEAGRVLSEYQTKYYTCHCTGVEQYEYLKHQMKEQVEYIVAGDCIEV